jgi:hypothetical protein
MCISRIAHRPPHHPKGRLTSTELTQLLQWIASDGTLRTDNQIVDEMVAALGFSRRGVRIKRAIQSAIACWRPRVQPPSSYSKRLKNIRFVGSRAVDFVTS